MWLYKQFTSDGCLISQCPIGKRETFYFFQRKCNTRHWLYRGIKVFLLKNPIGGAEAILRLAIAGR